MKSRIRKTLGYLSDKLGLLRPLIFLAQRKKDNTLTALMYHRVIDHQDPLFRGIDVVQFDAQMAYIAKHWQPVPEQQILDFYCRGIDLPTGAIFVTFDDGYKDAYTLALPILKKYGIPAILFVSSEPVGKGQPLWTDELALLIKHTNKDFLSLSINDTLFEYDLSNLQSRVTALFEIKRCLKRVADGLRKKKITEVREKLGAVSDDLRSDLLVNEAEMQELANSGVALGAHTKTHPILSKVSDEQAKQEIFESRDYLLELGYPQNSFCYPNGEKQDYNDSTLAFVAEAGYPIAFTTIEGVNDRYTNPLELRRLHVSGIPLHGFKYRLLLGLLRSKKKPLDE